MLLSRWLVVDLERDFTELELTVKKFTKPPYKGESGVWLTEDQATNDAAKNSPQRIKAIEDALRAHGLIN